MVFFLLELFFPSRKIKNSWLAALAFLIFLCSFSIVLYDAIESPYSRFRATDIIVTVLFCTTNIMDHVCIVSRTLRSDMRLPMKAILFLMTAIALFYLVRIIPSYFSNARRYF